MNKSQLTLDELKRLCRRMYQLQSEFYTTLNQLAHLGAWVFLACSWFLDNPIWIILASGCVVGAIRVKSQLRLLRMANVKYHLVSQHTELHEMTQRLEYEFVQSELLEVDKNFLPLACRTTKPGILCECKQFQLVWYLRFWCWVLDY